MYIQVYRAVCIASWNELHQRSAIGFCLLGSLAFHCLASDGQSISNCLREDNSFLKTAPFLLFQSCHQHKATSLLCCCCGTVPTLIVQRMSYAETEVGGIGTPRNAQNSAAFVQWNKRCSVVSYIEPQIMHDELSTLCFLKRFARHWIRCFLTSHMNNWTLGGEALFQMKSEAGSDCCLLIFRSS